MIVAPSETPEPGHSYITPFQELRRIALTRLAPTYARSSTLRANLTAGFSFNCASTLSGTRPSVDTIATASEVPSRRPREKFAMLMLFLPPRSAFAAAQGEVRDVDAVLAEHRAHVADHAGHVLVLHDDQEARERGLAIDAVHLQEARLAEHHRA